MPEIQKLKRLLEAIASGQAPETMLDDLKRVHGYDPRGLAREALSTLVDLAEQLPATTTTPR
jgi:hypothetical protein